MRKKNKAFVFLLALLAVLSVTLAAGCGKKNFIVSFETYGGGIIQPQTVFYGGSAAKPEDPYKKGYRFGGWYKDPLKNEAFDFETEITSDITLYAKYIKTFVVAFEICYDCGEDCWHQTEFIAADEFSCLSQPAVPQKDGYSFSGWFIDDEYSELYDFGKQVKSDFTLYAGWERIYYTITFDSSGGDFVAPHTVNIGDFTKEPPTPQKANSIFLGWFWDKDGLSRFEFGTELYADCVLYALWAEAYENAYRLTFHLIYPLIYSEGYFNADSIILCPEDPDINDYRFCGWYADSSFFTPFEFGGTLTRDTDIYACFIPLRTVVFYDGERIIEAIKMDDGVLISPPEVLDKDGFVFDKWYADSLLLQPFDFDKPITQDTVIFAGWLKKQAFTVSFWGMDGELLSRIDVLELDSVTPPMPPYVEYYIFSHWTDENGHLDENAFLSVVKNMDCFAGYAYNSTDSEEFGYTLYSGGYLINSVLATDSSLILPIEFNGFAVLGVADTAGGILRGKNVSFVFIPSQYTYIGNFAFYNDGGRNDGVTVVFEQDSCLKTVGDYAFCGVEIDSLPLNIETIGTAAFSRTSISKAEFSRLKKIGESAFALSTIGSLVWDCGADISADTFYNASIGSAVFSGGFTAVGDRAFYRADIFGTLILPDALTRIGTAAFSFCLLEEVALPQGVEFIGDAAFADMPNLRRINIPDFLAGIAPDLFLNCDKLSEVIFGGGSRLAGIGAAAFKNTAVAKIDLPDTVTYIGPLAFSGTPLVQIQLPLWLAELDFGVFEACGFLQSIIIPPSSQNIKFSNPEYLNGKSFNGFVVEDGNKYFSVLGDIHLYSYGGERLVVFIDCQNYVCPPSLRVIESRAFVGKYNLQSVKIGENVTSIGDFAFAGNPNACMNLLLVDFSSAKNLSYLGEGAFKNNCALIQADLSGCMSLKELSKDCFLGCEKLNLIKLPDGMKTIGERAFAFDISASGALMDLDLSAAFLQEIKRDAFAGRTSLKNVKLPSGLKIINGFNGCINLSSVSFGSSISVTLDNGDSNGGLEEIGAYAFYGCLLSGAFRVPESVVKIGEFAFAYSGITTFAPLNLTKTGACAFIGSRLSSADLSRSNLFSISDYFFYGADLLNAVIFPDCLEEIGEFAFAETALTEVKLPASVRYVYSGAFADCVRLAAVYFGNHIKGSDLSYFGIMPFEGCLRLESVYIYAQMPPMVTAPARGIANKGRFNGYEKLANLKVFVPKGCRQAYIDAVNYSFDYYGEKSWQFHTGQLYEM